MKTFCKKVMFITLAVLMSIALLAQEEGLKGEYFNNLALTGAPDHTQTDPTINFNWGTSGPIGIGPDNFTVQWSGMITPRYSGMYTFYATADDGVRLRINGQTIINRWGTNPATEFRGKYSLTAGKQYHIVCQYKEDGGEASIRLEWSSDQQTREIVPAAQLYPQFVGEEPADSGKTYLAPGSYIKGKFTPPDGQVLQIIGQDLDGIEGYTGNVISTPGGVTQYTDIANNNQPWVLYGLYGLNKVSDNPPLASDDVDYGAGAIHVERTVYDYPNSALQVGLYLVGSLGSINAGSMDQYVEELGNFFKQVSPTPVYLRIGYEFDGSWNSYSAGEYVQTFKYLVDYWRGMKVENVAYVWQSATYGNSPTAIENWYPGDDYVDWTGCSYFVYNTAPFDNILKFSRDHNKPMMICESTPEYYDISAEDSYATNGSSHTKVSARYIWDAWFAGIFDLIYSNTDVIRAFSYINTEWNKQAMWGDIWGDSRIESNPEIQKWWMQEMDKQTLEKDGRKLFLQGSTDLFSVLWDGNMPEPTCDDGVKNGDEEGIDCGGSCPNQCPEPTCYDGIHNGDEEGVDCGGSCPKGCPGSGTCKDFGASYVNDNTIRVYHIDKGWSATWNYLCVDGYCQEGVKQDGYYYQDFTATLGQNYKIQFKVQDEAEGQYLSPEETVTFTEESCTFVQINGPACNDGIQNGDETGIDCGGSCPDSCPAEPTCDDGILNGDETGIDCGGSCPDSCSTEPTCSDGIQNGDEEGIDCGGSCDKICPEPGTCEEFGMTYQDDNTVLVYHKDKGWTGNWNYICLDNSCVQGDLSDGYYKKTFTATLGDEYTIQFKVQDDGSGQYVSPEKKATFTKDKCTFSAELKSKNASHTNEISKVSKIFVKPVPASDFITLVGIGESVNYSVYSLSGIKIMTGKGNVIDIANLESGIYLLKTQTNERVRFIKQ